MKGNLEERSSDGKRAAANTNEAKLRRTMAATGHGSSLVGYTHCPLRRAAHGGKCKCTVTGIVLLSISLLNSCTIEL